MNKEHLKIVIAAKKEFKNLKKSNLKSDQLLFDLQDLRDRLRGKYQMKMSHIKKYQDIQSDLNMLIDEIDKYWWNLFTGGRKSRAKV